MQIVPLKAIKPGESLVTLIMNSSHRAVQECGRSGQVGSCWLLVNISAGAALSGLCGLCGPVCVHALLKCSISDVLIGLKNILYFFLME